MIKLMEPIYIRVYNWYKEYPLVIQNVLRYTTPIEFSVAFMIAVFITLFMCILSIVLILLSLISILILLPFFILGSPFYVYNIIMKFKKDKANKITNKEK